MVDTSQVASKEISDFNLRQIGLFLNKIFSSTIKIFLVIICCLVNLDKLAKCKQILLVYIKASLFLETCMCII